MRILGGEKMKAKELIGKKVLRTKPVLMQTGLLDYSYCGGTPAIILGATDSHVYIKTRYGEKLWVLDSRWNDDNWVLYEDFEGLADPLKLFEMLADAYKLAGYPCSVCVNCERTYPSDWVDICGGLCPFCGKSHTKGE
jgi:hypothetical protein